MSDYVVMVKGGAKVFLGGPPLVKMAIHEDVDEETLGGAEMHSRVSGVSDYLAADEHDAIRLGREIVAQLNWRKRGRSKRVAVEEPRYDPDELLGLTSFDVRRPFEVREVIARVVDGSRFHEFKPTYGTHAGHRLRPHPRLSGRHPRQQRRALLRVVGEGRAVHPALQPDRHADRVPAEHHRLHGGQPLRAGRHHQGRRQAHQRGLEQHGAAPDDHDRRLVRRRQLRHVGPRLRPALRLHAGRTTASR